MAAVCVISLGIVMIFASLFGSMDQARYFSDYEVLAPWLEERLWDAQENLSVSGPQMASAAGEIELDTRKFGWSVSCSQVAGAEGLYQIDALLLWRSGKRQRTISRSMYGLYESEEDEEMSGAQEE